jgi:glycosyltransferase involved in cell wall biosynthesis
MANRYERFLAAHAEPEWWSISRRDERKALRRADGVIAIQEQEAAYFRRLAGVPVTTVGHITNVHSLAPSTASAPTLLFVGSSNGVNQEGVKWLLATVWPEVLARCPTARLILVGTIGLVLKHLALPPNVEMIGPVDDVASSYAPAHVVVNPLRFGTGLKIKSVEAMRYGRALVSTSIGAEGLDDAVGRGITIADTAATFADACVTLLTDADRRRSQEHAAIGFLEAWNARCRAALRDALIGPMTVDVVERR